MSDEKEYPPGSTAKPYYDREGNAVPLHTLVRREPEWATNIIRHYEVKTHDLQQQLTAARGGVNMYEWIKTEEEEPKGDFVPVIVAYTLDNEEWETTAIQYHINRGFIELVVNSRGGAGWEEFPYKVHYWAYYPSTKLLPLPKSD